MITNEHAKPSKAFVIALTLITIFLCIRYWIQENLQGKRANRLDNRRKYFTVISSNNHLKMVYIDYDNMENISLIQLSDSSNNSVEGLENSGLSYYDSSNNTIESPKNIEWDETIDYNYYNTGMLGTVEIPRKLCSKDVPLQTIVLVQTHHHDNDPFTNIMYRYGDLNQLTFALPKKPGFESYWPLKFHPSFINSSLIFTNHVHMLINPPYRYSTIKRYMPKDAIFIAVIYDPLKVHLSNLVRSFALGRAITSELGYSLKSSTSNMTSQEIIGELEKQFEVVLIGDYIHESLVVLRNTLCWSLTDLVFITSKKGDRDQDIPSDLKVLNQKGNEVDQAIYEHFNYTFWEKVKSYGAGFNSDLKEMEEMETKMEEDCSKNVKILGGQRTLGRKADTWNEPLCKRLRWSEHEYVSYLKKKPPLMDDSELLNGLKYLEESLNIFFNTTRKQILELESL